MTESGFILDCVHFLYYKCHKISFKQGGLYIYSADWIKSKKATISPIRKKDSERFQYGVTVKLNHEKIKNYPQILTKSKPFIDKYNWKEIDYP